MKRVQIRPDWPDSWKYSYPYDLQEIYSEVTHRGYAYAYKNRRKKTLDLIQEKLASGRILDVAGAQGNFSLTLAEAGYDVVWNDLRNELEAYVKLKHERGRIEYRAGNVFNLGFREEFDCVLVTEIIEHVAHPDEFLSKISEMVKPGGYIIMSTPNGGYFRNDLPRFTACADPSIFEEIQFKPNSDGHIFLLWSDEVQMLAERAGLAVEKHELFTSPLTTGHMKSEKILRFMPEGLVFGLERLAGYFPESIKARLMVQSATRFRKLPLPDQSSSSPFETAGATVLREHSH